MIRSARNAVAATTAMLMTPSSNSSWLSVDSTSVRGIARTTMSPWKESSGQSVTRNLATPLVPDTVNGGLGTSVPALGRDFGRTGLPCGGLGSDGGAVTLASTTDPY